MAKRIKHKGITLQVKRALENTEASRFRRDAMLSWAFEEPAPNPENYENSFWEYQNDVQRVMANLSKEQRDSFYPEFFVNNIRYLSSRKKSV